MAEMQWERLVPGWTVTGSRRLRTFRRSSATDGTRAVTAPSVSSVTAQSVARLTFRPRRRPNREPDRIRRRRLLASGPWIVPIPPGSGSPSLRPRASAAAGTPAGEVPPIGGLALIVASPIIYSVWIVLSARLAGERRETVGRDGDGGADAAVATALMMTGTATTYWLTALAVGAPVG